MGLRKLFIPLICTLSVIACSRWDSEEPIPAYLHVNPVSLFADSATQGSSSSNIQEAWIYVDDQSIGMYELPAVIPVLFDNSKLNDIKVLPTIRKNGISSTKTDYPFFSQYSIKKDLIEAKDDTINPVITYLASATFPFMHNFESPDSAFVHNSSGVRMIRTTSERFEDDYSGKVNMGVSDSLFEMVSLNKFTLKSFPLYFEMDYSTNINLVVGIKGTSAAGNSKLVPTIILLPTVASGVKWNKIYIDFSADADMLNEQGFTSHQIYFKAAKANGDPSSVIMLDNLKIVHF